MHVQSPEKSVLIVKTNDKERLSTVALFNENGAFSAIQLKRNLNFDNANVFLFCS